MSSIIYQGKPFDTANQLSSSLSNFKAAYRLAQLKSIRNNMPCWVSGEDSFAAFDELGQDITSQFKTQVESIEEFTPLADLIEIAGFDIQKGDILKLTFSNGVLEGEFVDVDSYYLSVKNQEGIHRFTTYFNVRPDYGGGILPAIRDGLVKVEKVG